MEQNPRAVRQAPGLRPTAARIDSAQPCEVVTEAIEALAQGTLRAMHERVRVHWCLCDDFEQHIAALSRPARGAGQLAANGAAPPTGETDGATPGGGFSDDSAVSVDDQPAQPLLAGLDAQRPFHRYGGSGGSRNGAVD